MESLMIYPGKPTFIQPAALAGRRLADLVKTNAKRKLTILVDAELEVFPGAEILDSGGDEIINMFTPFMYTGASYKLFRRAVLMHPTGAELMPSTIDDLKPLD